MMRSYCDEAFVSELATAAGYYRGKAEIMQMAIQRIVSEPDNYANQLELARLAKEDMEAGLDRMMARHGVNVGEKQDA